jgi:arylsulfatase A-like enzyme
MIRLSLLLALLAAPLAAAKPNIIVIFVDDLGYADLACQGQEKDVFTPNLDRFAAQGIRCTAGYTTAPQCSPARAGLLLYNRMSHKFKAAGFTQRPRRRGEVVAISE